MELFKPSKKVLETICGRQTPTILYEIYPRPKTSLMREKQTHLFVSGLSAKLCEFYRINLNDETRKQLGIQQVWEVSGEMLKNCFDHGPKNKDIFFGLFLGNKGICYGFQDGGDYFKSDKIKYQYENKIEITDFDRSTLRANCQSGVNDFIYHFADRIEVDAEKGILYCVQLKETIIAPEGEKGSVYCDRLRYREK
jgi:hypothetical protein